MFPSERFIVDVPRARFSILEAERRILVGNKLSTEASMPQSNDPAIDMLKNEALEGIASRGNERQREAMLSLVHESKGDQAQLNLLRVVEMTAHKIESPLVTVDDVNALIENDAMLASSPSLRRCFRCQWHKIEAKQKERISNTQKDK